MKKVLTLFSLLLIPAIALFIAVPGITHAKATISSSEYAVGDTVIIEGSITPGQELYIAVPSQMTFAPKDTTGPHEIKTLKKVGKKLGFG